MHAGASMPPEPYPGNPLTPFLGSSGLADEVEMIKITPETLGREEMAWLWTALKADYRLTYPFQVSVVLMQPQRQDDGRPAGAATQGVEPQPSLVSPLPTLTEVNPPNDQPAAVLGDTVRSKGTNLTGAGGGLTRQFAFGHPTSHFSAVERRGRVLPIHVAQSQSATPTTQPNRPSGRRVPVDRAGAGGGEPRQYQWPASSDRAQDQSRLGARSIGFRLCGYSDRSLRPLSAPRPDRHLPSHWRPAAPGRFPLPPPNELAGFYLPNLLRPRAGSRPCGSGWTASTVRSST